MNNQEIGVILQLIRNDEVARNHFFRKLETAENPLPLLKPLKDEGYFDGKQNREPVPAPEQKGFYSIPYWNVLGFLENIAKQNEKKPDKEITNTLLEIIDSITSWKNPETGQRVDNYHTDRYILKIISNLPINSIEEKHIRLLDMFLRSKFGGMVIASEIKKTIMARLIEHKKKDLLLILLEIILDFEENSNNHREKFRPLMDKYWLKEVLKKSNAEIAKICAAEATDLAIGKIEKILHVDQNAFNCISIPSIEEHEQNWGTDRYEFQLVFFIRDMLCWGDVAEVKPKMVKLLKGDHPVFKRLGLSGVDKHYTETKDLFWQWGKNPLFEIDCIRELYNLVENHCEDFSEENIKKFLSWVENLVYEDEADKETIAYRRKKWLLPFKEKSKYQNHKEINRLFRKYHELNPAIPSHPGWPSWHETAWGHEEAFDEKEFLFKTNKEQVEFLNKYRFEQGWRMPEPNDVAYKLQQVVTEQPQRFAEDIMTFWEIKRDGDKLALLRGLKDAWDKEKDFGWEYIFDFCKRIFEEPDFWDNKYDDREYDYRRAFIQGVCDLLTAGMSKDSHAFNAKLLPRAENILLELGQKTRTLVENEKPTITAVINSIKYSVFSAVMNYALRYARLYAKTEQIKWPDKIKEYFEIGLDKEQEPSLYYSTALGRYLTNLGYLDKNWVQQNINSIFPKENEPHWKAAFMGYLSTGKVYKDIYLLLRENGHYEKALKVNFEDEYTNKYVVQHVCIGYLSGDEILNNSESLIYKLLEKDGVEVIGGIVEFLRPADDPRSKSQSDKIKPLWRKLYELLKAKEDNPDYQNVIRELCSWLEHIDMIDKDIVKWVKFSIDHIKNIWDAYEVPGYFLSHARQTPKEIGDLYLYMLNRGFYPDYEKENIQKLVEILCESKEQDKANQICRLYQARGYEFLKDVYEKNNA